MDSNKHEKKILKSEQMKAMRSGFVLIKMLKYKKKRGEEITLKTDFESNTDKEKNNDFKAE